MLIQVCLRVKIMALTTSDNNLFTSEYDGGVYLSTDDGANWNITGITVEYIYGFATIGTNLFAASTNKWSLSFNR